MLAVGACLVIHQESTPGIIIAGSILSARALAPVDLAIAHWRGFVAARQSWQRLSRLLGHLPPRTEPMPLQPPAKTLVVQNAAVCPPGEQKIVCQDVNFTLAGGKALGVIGPTASGKSSLARMLVGVWAPARGTVRLDGATFDQWSHEALGRHIGYLPQDVELFPGNVAQNIAASKIRPIPRRSSPPPRRPAFTTSSSICPTAMKPKSATMAARCRPVRRSASRWRGRSIAIRS